MAVLVIKTTVFQFGCKGNGAGGKRKKKVRRRARGSKVQRSQEEPDQISSFPLWTFGPLALCTFFNYFCPKPPHAIIVGTCTGNGEGIFIGEPID